MSIGLTIALIGVSLFLLMALTWACGVRSGHWGTVDVVWSGSLAMNALLFVLIADLANGLRAWLVACCVAFWSLRLGFYLWRRLRLSGVDDPRYVSLAENWGDKAKQKMFLFFQAQGLTSLILSFSVFVAMASPAPALGLWDLVGGAWILLAVIGEATADAQLARFKRNPENKGGICKEGLWRYSRHPNYFFEWFYWIAFFFFSVSSPWWWVSLTAPLVMLYAILFKTGIPPTEQQMLATRGSAYRKYQDETSAFFPWFPKNVS